MANISETRSQTIIAEKIDKESLEPGSNKNVSQILRNTFYSFVNRFVPVLIAFFVIPELIEGLGDERFGILSLGWVVLGYFSLFDLGLGRATTKFVSEYLALDKHREVPALIWTSWFMLFVLGVTASLLLYFSTPILLNNVLDITEQHLEEFRRVFILMALSIPVVIFTTGMRAVLEAYQQFRTLAGITTPASSLTYLIPYAALFFTQRLEIIVFLLLVNRVAFLAIYFWKSLRLVSNLGAARGVKWSLLPSLIKFGGWLTVTNVIGPLMTYLDRFLIGAIVSVSAVTYYVTPYEMLRKIQLLPTSLMTVLFPTFSGLHATSKERSARFFHRSVRLSTLAVMPVMLSLAVLSEDILQLWISEDFAERSASVVQWLALGIIINNAGQVAYNWIQAAGRSDVTAKFHLVELPFFLLLIWWLAQIFGITGVAIAWTARVTVDTILLFWFASRLLTPSQRNFRYFLPIFMLGIVFTSGSVAAINTTDSIILHILYVALTCVLYIMVVWWQFVRPEEKREIMMVLKRKKNEART